MVFTSHLTCLFKCDLMNIYKVFQLGMICLCFPATSFFNPNSSLQISVKHSDLQSVPVHKRIFSFSLLFSFDRILWNGISSLEWICWETHAGVCTVTVMVIRLLFHLESNIMMTLKLDMKHICKKEVRRGAIWAREGSLGGRRGALHRCRGDGKELRASLRRGSRCRDQTAPRWLAWFCCRSPLVSHPVQ